MENASKALLIAGGIFLGIITLSILVVLMNNISNIGSSQEEKRKAEELAAWNAEWEAYNKGFLRGADVLTVVNKAKQNNIEYKNNLEYQVEVKVNINPDEGWYEYLPDAEVQKEVALRTTHVFSCVNIEYSEKTGRVNKIEYKIADRRGAQ